jgi:hypothetical protein
MTTNKQNSFGFFFCVYFVWFFSFFGGGGALARLALGHLDHIVDHAELGILALWCDDTDDLGPREGCCDFRGRLEGRDEIRGRLARRSLDARPLAPVDLHDNIHCRRDEIGGHNGRPRNIMHVVRNRRLSGGGVATGVDVRGWGWGARGIR